ncbi:S9 family peptidase [Aurantiacibacter flavus]|uniref:Alpha/beta fold hydrolase n=1 Tax=Aurantiacibacter flavus TaxID=3145232 RepID=A0ABV0CVP8_9SPHN
MNRIIVRLARPFAVLAMATFAVPSALAQDAPPLEAYGDLPGIEDMAISRSGDYFAVFTTLRDLRQVLVLDSEQQFVHRFAVGEMKFRGFSFIGDDALLISRSQTVDAGFGFAADRYELTQALVVPLDPARDAAVVFGERPNLMNSVFGNYGIRPSGDGYRGYFGAIENRRNGTAGWSFGHGRPFLYSYDFATGEQRRIAQAPPEGARRDWLVDGEGNVAATFNISNRSGNWDIRNAANRTIAEGVEREGDVGLVGLGPDGTSLIYSEQDQDEGKHHWYSVPLAGGEPQPFLDDISVDRLYWDRDTGQLTGYYSEDEAEDADAKAADGLVMFDPDLQTRARMVLAAFPDRNPRLMDWTPDFSVVLVRTDGNGDPGTWYWVNLAARRADPIGYDRPSIQPEQVGPISTMAYTAQDGLEMEAIVTLPPGREAENLPVIVFPHGGPHAHDEQGFDWWAQAFASRGYAVIQPNFRGSTGYGADFEQAGYGEWGRKMQTDVSDALAALAQQGVVDPARACIVGASYGGYAALAGVTLQQGLYRCAVSVAGIGDIGMMYRTENRESGRNRLFSRSLREELGDSSGWDAISPRKFAAQADAPVLLIHGRDDTVVNFEQSAKMADALKDEGKPYRLVELEGEDHWLSLAATRQQMLSETMAFVQEHNPAD